MVQTETEDFILTKDDKITNNFTFFDIKNKNSTFAGYIF